MAGFTTIAVRADDNNDDLRNRTVLGIKGGINISNVFDVSNEDFTHDSKIGIAAGGFMSIPISEILGVQPELLFSQRGFNANGNILGSPYGYSRTLNYLDIPLLFAFKPAEFFTAFLGPQFGWLLSQTTEYSNGDQTVKETIDFDNNNIRKNTLSLVIGADGNWQNLVVSGRAGWDLHNNNGNGNTSIPRYKNAWVQLTVGYRFYTP